MMVKKILNEKTISALEASKNIFSDRIYKKKYKFTPLDDFGNIVVVNGIEGILEEIKE